MTCQRPSGSKKISSTCWPLGPSLRSRDLTGASAPPVGGGWGPIDRANVNAGLSKSDTIRPLRCRKAYGAQLWGFGARKRNAWRKLSQTCDSGVAVECMAPLPPIADGKTVRSPDTEAPQEAIRFDLHIPPFVLDADRE
mmetsp:Transcript_112610/g.223898  ORF Transcript_112610/g.223898 Transcript_112610/m.223898 type:complete len:139 (-) Transcript_112610:1813-2229(-)|eukprot:CAMPEP_0172840710 /NCGR_PEP_ID=MMETSP1075-20121228/29506_1 /TAXON_ID=2916 /ORGANISM="Ceratium fusus, Strain PA161109" /LENGTH=138 /DNA_ID=CAMNT_0013684593 /DNA_START=394 /DNA_END=810 /DNA_ORIENTATION=-